MTTWFLPEGTGVEQRGQDADRSLHSNRCLTGSASAAATAIGSNEISVSLNSEIRTSKLAGTLAHGDQDGTLGCWIGCDVPAVRRSARGGNRLTLPQPEESISKWQLVDPVRTATPRLHTDIAA